MSTYYGKISSSPTNAGFTTISRFVLQTTIKSSHRTSLKILSYAAGTETLSVRNDDSAIPGERRSRQLRIRAKAQACFYAVSVTFPSDESRSGHPNRAVPDLPRESLAIDDLRKDRVRRAMERVLVIVPAFREEASVANVVGQIRALSATGMDRHVLDVLVVDDGSTDATALRARAAGAIVASLPVNLGVGAALQTGFRYAVAHGYTTVVTVDADGQHPVSHIPALLNVDGAALVVGSRFVPGSVAPEWVSSTRSAAMGVLRRRLTKRTGVRLYDPTSGFRVIREPLLTRFAVDFPATYLGDTFEAHLSAAAVLGADRIAEVSVPMKARATGVPSSVGVRNLAYFARALLTTARPVWQPLGSRGRSTLSSSPSPVRLRASAATGAVVDSSTVGSAEVNTDLLREFGLRFGGKPEGLSAISDTRPTSQKGSHA
jgi:Glycosyl transferase family 2